MKRVDLEIRVSIRGMLKSPDRETRTLGWTMFLNEYQDEIIRRLSINYWPTLINIDQAVEFLTRSIANSKRYLNKHGS